MDSIQIGLDSVQLIGLLGNGALAVCALPQVWAAMQGASLDGLSYGFLGLWFGGELLAAIYTIASLQGNVFLMMNYTINLAAIAYLLDKKRRAV